NGILRMKNVAILVPRGAAAVGCIEGSFIGFSRANEVLERMGRAPMFDARTIGITSDAQTYDRFISIRPDLTIADDYKADLIMIPAVNGDWNEVIAMNQE